MRAVQGDGLCVVAATSRAYSSRQASSAYCLGTGGSGPYGSFCLQGEKNPRSSIKVWGLVAIDVNSGASHVDILHDYSTSAVLLTLRRFCALRGWPALISSGVVRSADVEYHTPGPGMKAKGRSITISRSIQRLTVEEQDKPLAVLEDSNSSSVIADEAPTRN